MKTFHILASIYETPEEVNETHLKNKALDLIETSRPLHVEANSLLEAMIAFSNSLEYLEFRQQNYTSYKFYCAVEQGNLVHVNLPMDEWHILEDIYT